MIAWTKSKYFNPRTPCGVRPAVDVETMLDSLISIHAPRVGCDFRIKRPRGHAYDFNPRTPCGVRLDGTGQISGNPGFQSTHPVWGATLDDKGTLISIIEISIHAPRVGCDHQIG